VLHACRVERRAPVLTIGGLRELKIPFLWRPPTGVSDAAPVVEPAVERPQLLARRRRARASSKHP
jgi:hypothetical protein